MAYPPVHTAALMQHFNWQLFYHTSYSLDLIPFITCLNNVPNLALQVEGVSDETVKYGREF
jgi:hypothetical protein